MNGRRYTWGCGLAAGCLMAVMGMGAGAEPAGTGGLHRLADFGPVGRPEEIRATYDAAVEALSVSGGILTLAPAESKVLNAQNNSQRSFREPPPPAPAKRWGTGPGFTIVDTGAQTTTVKVPQMSGLRFDRTLRMDSNDSLPHWTTDHLLKLNNTLVHGGNSYLDWITDPVAKGPDARFYLPTVRGIRPGQFLNAHAGPGYRGGVERLYVKSVGYDKERRQHYFVADAELDHVAGAIVQNKNNVGLIWLNQNCNTDEQTYDIMLRRRQYAAGDTYMFFGWYEYMSDIHSAAGDENGTIFGGYVKSLVNNFRAQIQDVDWPARTLRFRNGQNAETLANSRPLINLNPAKWITAGKVRIVPAESYTGGADTGKYPFEGRTYPSGTWQNPATGVTGLRMGGLIRGDKDAPWDESIIGRFFAVTEPSEAIEGKLYRWYEITGLTVNPDGTKDMLIRRLWWGAKDAGSPSLYREDNYTWDGHERPLAYAIAPGAFVNDVSKAVPSEGFKTEPVLGMSPHPDAGAAFDFADGDAVEQAIGPDPFKPIPFRMWMWDKVPGPFPAPVLDVANFGIQRYAALNVRGGPDNLDKVPATKEGKAPWENGVIFESVADNAVNFRADVANAALFFQQPYREQPIKWLYRPESNQPPREATLTVSRETGQLAFTGSARFEGLSGDETPARNLRGKNVPVATGQTTLEVAFAHAEADGDYAVFIEQNWIGSRAVVRKHADGFTVAFDPPAPENALLDWMIVR